MGLLTSNAQNYIPFPDSNAVWRSECAQGFQGEDHWYNYYSVGVDDTIIGSYTYHILNGGSEGAYRNDDTARKVYYVPPLDTTEVLLYDFSLQVGDTFKIPTVFTYCFDSIGVVASIDSVLIGAQYRRRINFSVIWDIIAPHIEGIGSTSGLLEYYNICFEYGCYLICFKQNDTIYWGNEIQCQPWANEVNYYEQSNREILLYPNPSIGVLTIQGNYELPAVMELYDITGRKVLQLAINNEQLTIDVSHLSKGLYLYHLTTGTTTARGKVVVE